METRWEGTRERGEGRGRKQERSRGVEGRGGSSGILTSEQGNGRPRKQHKLKMHEASSEGAALLAMVRRQGETGSLRKL